MTKSSLADLNEDQLDTLAEVLKTKVVDPEGKAEKIKERILKDHDAFWLRKVVSLSGIQTASASMLNTSVTPMQRSLVKALHGIYAADLILDLKEHYPDAVPEELASGIIADAQELIEVVTGLAVELESSGTLATLLAEAGPTRH